MRLWQSGTSSHDIIRRLCLLLQRCSIHAGVGLGGYGTCTLVFSPEKGNGFSKVGLSTEAFQTTIAQHVTDTSTLVFPSQVNVSLQLVRRDPHQARVRHSNHKKIATDDGLFVGTSRHHPLAGPCGSRQRHRYPHSKGNSEGERPGRCRRVACAGASCRSRHFFLVVVTAALDPTFARNNAAAACARLASRPTGLCASGRPYNQKPIVLETPGGTRIPCAPAAAAAHHPPPL